jgi:cell division protein ZapE
VSEITVSATGATGAAAAAAEASVLQRYQRQLRERGLQEDAAQLAVITKLDELRTRLIADHHGVRLPRWLGALWARRARAPVPGLYLWGGVGRGKTWLMDLFFESLPAATARRTHFHRFMQDVHRQLAQLRRRRSPLERLATSLARTTRVLCLDELYVSDIGDAMILYGLFAAMFERGVTLVATSNVPPAELYRDGLQRERFLPAIGLLERHLDIEQLAGSTDYRLRQLTQAGTYLQADAPDTRARLAALFGALTDSQPRGGSIEIEDRPIAVRGAAPGAVWFEFAALCGGPRSQDDYIEIARDYQSVIVADVPRLDSDHDDEARRFIALVDELYDRGVNLIVSAAAAPTQLYQGERLRALFARTASRLTEMQSEQYLAREHRP